MRTINQKGKGIPFLTLTFVNPQMTNYNHYGSLPNTIFSEFRLRQDNLDFTKKCDGFNTYNYVVA